MPDEPGGSKDNDNDGSSSILFGSDSSNFKNVGTKTGKGKARGKRNNGTGRSLNSNSSAGRRSPNADHLIGTFFVVFINNFHLFWIIFQCIFVDVIVSFFKFLSWLLIS